MDSFLRRLKYYGIGFSIGLIFVIFFFQNRGCSWLPGNRVKNSFIDRLIVLPEDQAEKMKALGLTSQDIVTVLNDGDVDFQSSIKKGNPKVYAVDKEFEGKGTLRFYFTLPNESFISEVHLTEKKAYQVKNTTSGFGDILNFPKDDNLVYVDSADQIVCQQEELGLINPLDILKLIKKSGKIDFSKTNYKVSPKAEQYLTFNDKKKRTIGVKAVWYKNKINITSFDYDFETKCK